LTVPLDANRVQAVYQAAVAAVGVTAQAALLDRECGADRELRQQVETMLQGPQELAATLMGEPMIAADATLNAKSPESVQETGETPLQPRFSAGSQLGKYKIKCFLARGGMGEVYRGFDPLIERDVALKVLPAGLATNTDSMQRFLAEARAVGKLLHSNTVALYEIGHHEESMFLAMEFVPGGSVGDLLAKEGKLDWKRATRFMHEVCQGLAAAHAVGVVHRDIKPENLLRTTDDHVKITDFGLAKALDAMSKPNLTKPGNVLGTPVYMSPEQFTGVGVDHRCDLYAAGGTYYHLLTGQWPYANATNIMQIMFAHSTGPIPDPRAVVPDLPAGCAAVVKKAMAKRPEDRYATAAEMAAALAPLLEEKPVPAEVVFWLVEPSRLQARSLQGVLGELGVTKTRVFANVADTLAAAAQGLPTVILAALHLADGTGEELAAKIQGLPGGGGVFSFLLSSDAAAANPTAYRPGRPIVLAKPVTKDMLAHVVGRVRALTG
jgi:CheY-like chemotaxis protein